MLYRFPFDLTIFFEKAGTDLFGSKFFFRINLLGNAMCAGSSEVIQLDYKSASLSIESPLRAQYDADSVLEFVVTTAASPNRNVQCSLVHDGTLWDTTMALLADFVTGSAGSKQFKLLRPRLPATLPYYGDCFIFCETTDKRQPELKFQTNVNRTPQVKFKVEKGVGSINITEPLVGARWRAGEVLRVSWVTKLNSGQALPTAGASLRLHRAGAVSDDGLPTVQQQWDVSLASLTASVPLDAEAEPGADYYLALYVSQTAVIHSASFFVDGAIGRPPPAPTPVPPTAEPEATVTAPAGFTVATVLTPFPTPFVPPPPPTPFVVRTFTRSGAAGGTTTLSRTAPPDACGTRANGEFLRPDKCGVCGGSSVQCEQTGDSSQGTIIGAAVGGSVALLLIVIVIFVVVCKRRRAARSGARDTASSSGANIVLAESRLPPTTVYATEESIF